MLPPRPLTQLSGWGTQSGGPQVSEASGPPAGVGGTFTGSKPRPGKGSAGKCEPRGRGVGTRSPDRPRGRRATPARPRPATRRAPPRPIGCSPPRPSFAPPRPAWPRPIGCSSPPPPRPSLAPPDWPLSWSPRPARRPLAAAQPGPPAGSESAEPEPSGRGTGADPGPAAAAAGPRPPRPARCRPNSDRLEGTWSRAGAPSRGPVAEGGALPSGRTRFCLWSRRPEAAIVCAPGAGAGRGG